MTDISGLGALNATLLQSAIQFADRRAQQSDQEGQELAQRRVEQLREGASEKDLNGKEISQLRVEHARKGSPDNDLGVPGNEAFDFETDSVQKRQVNDVVDHNIRRENVVTSNEAEASRRADVGIEITLSNSLERAQESAVRITTENTVGAERSLQDGIAQTEASLNSGDFTRTIDEKRDRADASNLESRADKKLGRVIDTFA